VSRKHNTKHRRTRSRYVDRLRKRGQSSASVRMEDVDVLRARQQRRGYETGSPQPASGGRP